MFQFSNLNKKLTLEDFIYSELLAVYVLNSSFFDFLNNEKWKYLMNDQVFKTSLDFEIQRLNITVLKDKIDVKIERDWNYLKTITEIGNLLKNIVSIKNITVSERNLTFFSENNYFNFKDTNEKLTLSNFYKLFNLSENDLYSKNYDAFIRLFINHIKNYLKPDYLVGIEYFENIFKEKGLILNFENYYDFKTMGLGFKKDDLPKLCYNNLYDYCIDLCNEEKSFRDYDLMKSLWLKTKETDFCFKIVEPLLKGILITNIFDFITTKDELEDKDYYTWKNNLIKVKSLQDTKTDMKGYWTLDFETCNNHNNNLTVIMKKDSIEKFKICIGFDFCPSHINFSIE